MLTKQDLNQIQKIVQSTVQEEIKPLKQNVSSLKQDVSTLKQDVSSLKQDVSTLKQDVSAVKKDVSTMQDDIVEIRKDQKLIVTFFDREYLELRKRVERIENHLDLHPAS